MIAELSPRRVMASAGAGTAIRQRPRARTILALVRFPLDEQSLVPDRPSGASMKPKARSVPTSLLLLLAVLTALASACRPDRSLERLEAGEALKVGYAIEAPYAFVGERGEVTGESPELAKLIVRALNSNAPEALAPETAALRGRFDRLHYICEA